MGQNSDGPLLRSTILVIQVSRPTRPRARAGCTGEAALGVVRSSGGPVRVKYLPTYRQNQVRWPDPPVAPASKRAGAPGPPRVDPVMDPVKLGARRRAPPWRRRQTGRRRRAPTWRRRQNQGQVRASVKPRQTPSKPRRPSGPYYPPLLTPLYAELPAAPAPAPPDSP